MTHCRFVFNLSRSSFRFGRVAFSRFCQNKRFGNNWMLLLMRNYLWRNVNYGWTVKLYSDSINRRWILRLTYRLVYISSTYNLKLLITIQNLLLLFIKAFTTISLKMLVKIWRRFEARLCVLNSPELLLKYIGKR